MSYKFKESRLWEPFGRMSIDNVILKHRRLLLENINSSGVLLETLYADNVITELQYQSIKYEKLPLKKTQLLLDFMKHKRITDFLKFCNALNEDYTWISNQLLCEVEATGVNSNDHVGVEENLTFEIPADKASLVPTEKEMMKLSKALISFNCDWEMLAFDLGLKTADIERCKKSNSTEIMQCMSMLVTWLRRHGSSAVFSKLYEVIKTTHCDPACMINLIKIFSDE
ncbi:unnamed protein product [Clavelina lepadiformis]|uniref:Death domain-containing protein n=1 Tax=Clavelina lepadiformis TaxID=159417 RepID=A0ABP0FCJ3_CLALP